MPAAPCSFCGSTEGPDHICPGKNLQLIGQVLDGRYRIEDVLGQGGMGMVFSAIQTSVQRPVAVKTLHPTLAAAPQFYERFKREAEMASRLHHPNIITIYDFGQTPDGTCYYVMELLDGVSLKQLVKSEGPLSMGRAFALIEQAARALGHAHENGVIHRDVKPHNMMVQTLDQKDFVKVLDFGLVKAMEQDENQQLTSTGQVLGTPQYMPPEQAGGDVVDHRSDLYSLAGVLYFCLTGSSPFGANTVRKALQSALTQTVPPVGRKRVGAPVPSEVDAFFRKALAREKEDRHQSAEEFIEDLRASIAGMSEAELWARPVPPDPNAPPAKEGSGSGSSARRSGGAGGTVSVRRGSSGGGSRSGRAPSNVVVDSAVARESSALIEPPPPPPRRSGSGISVAPPPAARTGSGKAASGGLGKIALVAAPVVILAAVGVWFVWGLSPSSTPQPDIKVVEIPSPPRDTPRPAKPAPSDEIAVHFESDPPGVGIYDGEVQIGTTPADLRVKRDKAHTLTFRLAGHEELERTYDFSHVAGDQTDVHVALKKLADRPASRPVSGKRRNTADDSNPVPVFE
ncbi:MAG: serine/threonine protein kinase [Myxococcaceae bacterium]|nr:serine/threonine protein kinase [Myxococcaceae bacterium]